MADGEGGGAGAAGLPADLGWERLENGRRILGALGERARAWHGGEFLAPVPEWIGELPGADQRCLLFAAAGTDESLHTLARLGRATSNRTMLKRLHAVLEEAAARRGQSAKALG